VLNLENQVVSSKKLNDLHRISNDETKKAFEKLQEMNYGKIAEQKAQNNLITTEFHKNSDLLVRKFTKTDIIEKYGEFKFEQDNDNSASKNKKRKK